MNIDKEKATIKTNNFEDYDLFEEFEVENLHISQGDDYKMDFTRWQQDYEDEIDADDFETTLSSVIVNKN